MRKLRPLILIVALVTAGGCGKKKDEPGTPPVAGKGGDGKGGGNGDGKGGGGGKGEGKGGGKGDGKGGGPAIKASAIAAGAHVSCALIDGGAVRCWGRSDAGELGTGRVEGQAASAVDVPGVSGAAKLFVGGDPGDSGDLACVINGGGKVSCWGYRGMFPDPQPSDKTPVAEVPGLTGAATISFGGGQGLALFGDGTVKGWGGNVFNALGVGKDTKVDNGAITLVPVKDVAAVASGQNHGCVAHKDGTVSCWGYSGKQLDPTKIDGAVDVAQLAAKAGGDDTCALTNTKTVLCWGGYDLKAKPVEGLTDVVGITARTHFCAVKLDGTVWCWGGNQRGQLGNGQMGDDVSKPTQVVGVTDAVAVSAGAQSSCALRKTGQVLCWGINRFGQLGDGTLVDRASPVEVKHLNDKSPPKPDDGLADVPQFAEKQAFDSLPEGCTHGGKLDAKFKTLAGPMDVVSAYATNEDGKGLTYKVTLANYQVDPAKLWDQPRGGQLQLNLRFAKIDLKAQTKTPKEIVPGIYSMDSKQDQLVYPSVADRTFTNIMLGSITLEGMKAGEVELTKLGDGWVCGEARIATKDSGFTGKFAAKLVDAK